MSAGLRALWTVWRGPWIFIFKLQQIVYILFWGQMGRYVWLQKHKFPPHTGRWPWYLLIVWLPGGGLHLIFSRCYYYYVCDGKKISFKDCEKCYNFCGKMLEITTFLCSRWVPFRPCGRCKATGSVFICHLLEIRQNENTNLTHGDVFTHNWFPRYAALQLYGLLVDLVWTGLLSLAALNKHLLEVKKVSYASRKIKFMLQNSSKWNTSLSFLSFCFFDTKLTGWKMPPKLLNFSHFLLTSPTDHHSLRFLHLCSQSKDDAVTFPVISLHSSGQNSDHTSQHTLSAKVGQGGAEVHCGL